MTTKLDKPVTRETSVMHKARPVLVTLIPRSYETAVADDTIEFRLKGTQQKIRLTVEAALRFALREGNIPPRTKRR